MLKKLRHERKILKNKVRFIDAVIQGEISIHNRPKQDILNELQSLGFDPSSDDNDAANDTESVSDTRGFDYLLSMKLWSLTKEQIQKLEKDYDNKKKEYDALEQMTPEELWREDLTALKEYLLTMDNASSAREAPVAIRETEEPRRKPKKKAAVQKPKEKDIKPKPNNPKPKAKAKKTSKEPAVVVVDDDDDDAEMLSLSQRLAKRMHVTPKKVQDESHADDVFNSKELRAQATQLAAALKKGSQPKPSKRPTVLKRRKAKTPMKPKSSTTIESPWKVSPDKKKQCVNTELTRRPQRKKPSKAYVLESSDEEDELDEASDPESEFDVSESAEEDEDDFESDDD